MCDYDIKNTVQLSDWRSSKGALTTVRDVGVGYSTTQFPHDNYKFKVNGDMFITGRIYGLNPIPRMYWVILKFTGTNIYITNTLPNSHSIPLTSDNYYIIAPNAGTFLGYTETPITPPYIEQDLGWLSIDQFHQYPRIRDTGNGEILMSPISYYMKVNATIDITMTIDDDKDPYFQIAIAYRDVPQGIQPLNFVEDNSIYQILDDYDNSPSKDFIKRLSALEISSGQETQRVTYMIPYKTSFFTHKKANELLFIIRSIPDTATIDNYEVNIEVQFGG